MTRMTYDDWEQAYDGQWWPAEGEVYTACCDCGLCHRWSYRLRGGQLEVRVDRDDARTRRVRRQGGLSYVRRKGTA